MQNNSKTLKSSKQRDLVLKILRNTHSHPTADWIYDQARSEMPNISKGTVYRNLKILKDEGKIRELSISRGVFRYDGDVRNHYHIQCLNCDRVENLPHAFPQINCKEIERITGFQVHRHKLEIIGICPHCRGNNRQGVGL